MEEAKASWNTVYVDRNGFQCQLTLRDEDEEALARRVAAVTASLLEAGGTPAMRSHNGRAQAGTDTPQAARGPGGNTTPEKTYVDRRGMRRCNMRLGSGARCNQPVVEKEGRYGLFWSCPAFRDHHPRPDNR